MLNGSPGSEQDAWDIGYQKGRKKYGGAPPQLPALAPGSRVLEAGCGDGKSLTAMACRGWDVIAFDSSWYSLRICERTPGLSMAGYLQADARAMPFPSGTFDTVFLTHLLGHTTSRGRSRMAAEASRVLRNEGRLFIRVFSSRDFRAGKGMLTEPDTYLRGDGISTHYFSLDEVRTLFAGLSPAVLETQEWPLKVRGEVFLRSEIMAEFRK